MLAFGENSYSFEVLNHTLLKHFGEPETYCRLNPVSQLVLGMLGGKTRTEVSARVFIDLIERFGSWQQLRDAATIDVWQTIAPVTFSERKARNLQAALRVVTGLRGGLDLDHLADMNVADALGWLEQLPGVGRKTAAATLNFSTLRMPALVIDSHHLRVLKRLGLLGEREQFVAAYDLIVPQLPEHWTAEDFDEHHTCMKRLGQDVCISSMPDCRRCPLAGLCPTGARLSGRRLRGQTYEAHSTISRFQGTSSPMGSPSSRA